MDIVLTVICICMLVVSGISLAITISLLPRLKKMEGSNRNDKKIDDLKESIYNEFSRNRTEQNNIGQAQREEISKQILEVNKRLQSLT